MGKLATSIFTRSSSTACSCASRTPRCASIRPHRPRTRYPRRTPDDGAAREPRAPPAALPSQRRARADDV